MLSEYYSKGVRYYLDRFWLLSIPHWSEFRKISASKTVTSLFVFTSLVPILIRLFPADKEVCVFFDKGQLCIPFALPFSVTILFFAGWFATIASAIYVWRCPPWIKEYRNAKDFLESHMGNDELHDQANRFFDIEYGKNGIPRFLLFCNLICHNRTIASLHKDFDKNYHSLCDWAVKPKKHGIASEQSASKLITNYIFIKRYVREEVGGELLFEGTIRDHIQSDPKSFFWKHYLLQDSSRQVSRVICSACFFISYFLLFLLFIQNTLVVVQYGFA